MEKKVLAVKQLTQNTQAVFSKLPDGYMTIIVYVDNRPREIMILKGETYPEGSIRRMLEKYWREEVSINQAIQEFNNYESRSPKEV